MHRLVGGKHYLLNPFCPYRSLRIFWGLKAAHVRVPKNRDEFVTPTAKNLQAREPRCDRGRAKGAFSFASFTLERAKKMMKEVVLLIISPLGTSLKARF